MTSAPTWSLRERRAWCARFRALIVSSRGELIDLVCAEVHKTPAEALTQEIMPLAAACRWHERFSAGILKPRRVPGRPLWMLGERHEVIRAPLGRVGIIATWNYPLQLLGVQIVQAMLGGNAVIVKPSERSPRSQRLLLEIARAAGADENVLRWTGAERSAAPRMLREQRLDHVLFTGSTQVGREVAAWAAQTLTGTTLELSGSDSALVRADADGALAARVIWQSVTMNGGQTCMAPRRAIVAAPVYGAFMRTLAALAAGEPPRRLIDGAAAERCRTVVAGASAGGGRVLGRYGANGRHPGACAAATASGSDRAAVFTPTAIAECPVDSAAFAGEHFGPVLAVVAAGDDAEVLALHETCPQRLNTMIFTRDVGAARRLAPRLGSGLVTINDGVVPSGHPGATLTGRGLSGWGASRGSVGLLAMTRPVTVARTGRWVRLPTDEPPAEQVRWLDRVTGWMYGGRGGGAGPNGTTAQNSISEFHASASELAPPASRLSSSSSPSSQAASAELRSEGVSAPGGTDHAQAQTGRAE